MSKPLSVLDSWLEADQDLLAATTMTDDEWLALFDADRQLVVSKLGPYKRMFLRPTDFNKRFYHQIYPIRIENWSYKREVSLFDGFCLVVLAIDIRFQATLAYLQRNSELLDTINAHIIATYDSQIDEIVDRELGKLNEGSWVKNGLQSSEKAVALAISELLTLQHIQAQCLCTIKARFQEFPEVKPGKDHVYLNVLKKAFELREEKNLENQRQQRLLEEHNLSEREQHLAFLRQLTELELQAQAIEAEKNRRLLQERQDQLVQQLAIEKDIHAEQIRHQAELRALELDLELREQEKNQAKKRLAEIQQLTAQLAHESEIEHQKALAQIQREALLASLESSDLTSSSTATGG